ncbi:YqaJ viral recombinase family protein [Streptomyces sp. NA04227]|uniref:YqaJ viral recombinase family nuclease n=1 Tax=Streptomyces sp. NA04227 TaxID=2742136 RepID=UPI0015917FFC|nr:YqaJ viral recombinase family protein [Streptomyces sp. NA04227]QKW08066.1 YqaJ viral recombinase family protein [Streptomyces sp. NA04227]
MTAGHSALATPTGRVVAPPGLSREDWFATRRRGVGGSDVAAVLGMDKYRGPLEVYLDKVGELPELPRDTDLDESAFWGHTLEPMVAEVFAERTGLHVTLGPGTLAHVDRPWMLANVDRLALEPGTVGSVGVLEIKTRSAYQLDEWREGVPDGPALQTHWYLAVTGYSQAHVAALIGGQRLVVHRVERDEQLVEHLVQLAGEFWQRVQDRTPPPVDESPATADLLAHLYEVEPDAVTLADPAEVQPLLDELATVKAREADLADERRAVEARLKTIAGAAEVVQVRGETAFTWRRNGTFASKRFAEAHPDLAAQYTRPRPALDVKRLAAEHPDLYRAHRARRLLVPAQKGKK